jgi:hypothetical protein
MNNFLYKIIAKAPKVLVVASLLLIATFFNMAIMFLPLKILFSLSLPDTAMTTVYVTSYFGENSYFIVMLASIFILMLITVLTKVLQDRFQSQLKNELLALELDLGGAAVSGETLSKVSVHATVIVSDILIIIVGLLIILILNPIIAMGYFLVGGLQFALAGMVMMTESAKAIQSFLGISKERLNEILHNIFFLLSFFIIAIVYIFAPFNVISAVLMLLLMRLGSQSIKKFFTSNSKLKKALVG